ncbi:hypothetical protein K0T92_07800 [Paenibacillus oenotherae]|uniref:Uncharacterized protein n=1 Tax=Paenibacillus oenotherae TaxID=1435645 RepID=A0ABS7D439_9BACL|nr:hypothetical protein [Paenibacillus oenotherae]MBW7474645.1 hypothetical protein [Paenibacillus oenotherae]
MKNVLVVVGAAVMLSLVTILFGPNRWKTIMTAAGNEMDELQDKHEYLGHKGIRSRLRIEEEEEIPAIMTLNYLTGTPSNKSMALLVHEEDLNKAVEALNKYEGLRYTAQTPLR